MESEKIHKVAYRSFEAVLHFIFWAFFYFLLESLFQTSLKEVQIIGGKKIVTEAESSASVFYFLIITLGGMIITYVNIFILYPRFIPGQKSLYTVLVIILVSIVIITIQFIKSTGKPPGILGLIILFFILVGISFTYILIRDWQVNVALKRQAEQEKLKAEINFLKSQINPHFLFNVLNSLYSMAQEVEAEEIADGISRLSEMMRYMLYETGTDTVLLTSELSFIEDYVDLQKLRLQDDCEVSMEIRGEMNGLSVAPMIFIPLIENAFKHGAKDASGEISIIFTREDSDIQLRITNRLIKENLQASTGVGISNLRKRLELLYPSRYQLIFTEDNRYFTALLTIQT